MPEITEDQMPQEGPITCSFCGHQDGGEEDLTIILVGTMGANICAPCVIKCAQTLSQHSQMQPKTEELPTEG